MKKKPALPVFDFAKQIEQDYFVSAVCPAAYTFEIGEKVRRGNHEDVTVLDKTEDGSFYAVLVKYSNREGEWERKDAVAWFDIDKLTVNESNFHVPTNVRYTKLASDIRSLIGKVTHFGVDFSPEYQRELVWTHEQKERLLDTIFAEGNIGTLAFNHLPFKSGAASYEIVDGKQRLTTIVDFFQDQFTYKGFYFSDLSRHDQNVFENLSVQTYQMENATRREVYELFLLINRRGTPVDEEHIEKVEKLLKNCN